MKNKSSSALRFKALVFSICLMVSALFWLLVNFNNVFSTSIEVPVKYINMPNENWLETGLPEKVRITITGSGYSLLTYTFRPNLAEFVVDGRNMGYNASNKESPAFIASYSGIDFFNRLHSDIKALHVMPDTIFLSSFSKVVKKVPVKLSADLRFEKQFFLSDSLKVSPDSVVVAGSPELLADIAYVETELLKRDKLDRSEALKLALKVPMKGVSFAPAEVAVALNVEKFTESQIEVPVFIEHLLNKDSLKIIPARARVVYLVGLSKYAKVSPDQFLVTVDAHDLALRKEDKLRLYLRKYPDFVRNPLLEPAYVDYIINKP